MRFRRTWVLAVALFAASAVACSSSGDEADKKAEPAAAIGASCATAGATAPKGCWVQARPLGSGGWPPGTTNTPVWEAGKFPLGMTPTVASGNELWMIGQTLAYSSPDGLAWTEYQKTDWGSRIYNPIVHFDGTFWMYGGLLYEARTFTNDIWSSEDGTRWKKAGTAAWPARGNQAMVAFDDRLWLFGGADHVAEDRSPDAFLNDVWVSDNGTDWTEVAAAAAWSPRDNPGVVVLDDALYMLGAEGHADVWRSTDGKEWTQLTAKADWAARNDYGHEVLDDKLWVFGGWAGTTTNALNDVWFSSDGETWSRQAEHAPWAPRGPVTTVFDDKIWIYSGKHTGAEDNWGGDLWQMTATTPA